MCVYIILSMLFLEFVFWENIVKADWVLLLIKSLILGFFPLLSRHLEMVTTQNVQIAVWIINIFTV